MPAAAALIATAGCATAQAAGPTLAEFSALHAAQCADHVAGVRNLSCQGFDEEPTEFRCRYDLPEFGGGWKKHEAIVGIDGSNWVWLDGETRCSVSAISNLN
jgi:hypothetical protein